MYLLDTDVIIYHLNGQQRARSFLQRLTSNPILISSVTLMEVEEGVPLGSDPAAAEDRWHRLLETIVLLPFGENEARRAAGIRRYLRAQGLSVRARPLDIMIAATALEHDLTLATNNHADFHGIPDLLIESP